MRLSTRGRYAVMAMVELASREAAAGALTEGQRRAPVPLAGIAAAQMLSLAYLEQLFGPMRRAGLVTSARGPGGGYRLAMPAEEISVAQIVAAVEEGVLAGRGDEDAPHRMAPGRDLTDGLWTELGEHLRLFLEQVTLADVLAGQVSGRARAPARVSAPA